MRRDTHKACTVLLCAFCFALSGCNGPNNHPASFTDHVVYPNQRAAFEMVLVPGSADGSIKPFYVGRTEVTWDMFRGWSYGADLLSTGEIKHELDRGLRPSELYADRPNARMGFGKRPAIGMTYDTARLYCDWLSRQTGRRYRLPTNAEWSHVLQLSGGVPAERDELLAQAVVFESAPPDELGLDVVSAEVASKAPDRLGLFDLLGNAAEWVQPAGDKRWVRGGHFYLEAESLTPEWRSVEDFDVWNASSPQLPDDASWYVDHFYQGIRLVCEVEAGRTLTHGVSRRPEGDAADRQRTRHTFPSPRRLAAGG